MSNLMVKNVDVMGDTIMAAKDEEGKIWAGVNYFCKALGMTKNQRDAQVSKVQYDKTLSKGCEKFPAGTFDQSNEAVVIQIDFLPLWLAKISVTPKMEKENPDLAKKLLNYQLQAKDILAAAFLPKQERLGDGQASEKICIYQVDEDLYILTMGGEVYTLSRLEMSVVGCSMKAMEANSVPNLEDVLRTMIDRFGHECRLEKYLSCNAKKQVVSAKDGAGK